MSEDKNIKNAANDNNSSRLVVLEADSGIRKDQRPLSRNLKPIGRPPSRFDELKTIPTRCPTPIYTYLKGISPFMGPSLTDMHQKMLQRFLAEKPWEHGLLWRKPKTAMTYVDGNANRTGWEQVNIQVVLPLAREIERQAKQVGVSKACFCYTAIFWWVQYIYPPQKMLPKVKAGSTR